MSVARTTAEFIRYCCYYCLKNRVSLRLYEILIFLKCRVSSWVIVDGSFEFNLILLCFVIFIWVIELAFGFPFVLGVGGGMVEESFSVFEEFSIIGSNFHFWWRGRAEYPRDYKRTYQKQVITKSMYLFSNGNYLTISKISYFESYKL